MSFLDTIKWLLGYGDKTTECISSVLEKLQENLSTLPHDIINTQMEIPDRDKGIVYKLDRWNWLLLMIDHLDNKNQLLPTVYYLARILDLKDICTGQINFFMDTSSPLAKSLPKSHSYIFTTDKIYSLVDKEYLDFLKKFDVCIRRKNISSISILFFKGRKFKERKDTLSNLIDGHATMLFIENKKNELNVYLYDPHGSKNVYYKKEADTFLDWLKIKYTEIYKKRVNIINRESFSCPIGIQGFIPEKKMSKEGYCIMYSYFWLYIILQCSTSIPNVNLNTLISDIEKSVISVARDPKTLAKIIYIFAENVVNTANTHIPNKKEYFRDVNKYMLQYISVKNPPSEPIQPREERKDVLEVESGHRKRDGENCEKDIDCLSHCCSRERKCIEIDYSGKFPTCGGSKVRTRPY